MNKILVVGRFDVLDASRVRYFKHLSTVGQVVVLVYVGDGEIPLMDRVDCLRACKYVTSVFITDPLTVRRAVVEAGATLFGGDEAGELDGQTFGLSNIRLPTDVGHRDISVAKPRPVPPAWLDY